MAVRLNLRHKLLAAFGILLVLNVLVGWGGISQAGRINDQAAQMYSDDLLGTVNIALLAQDTLLVRTTVPAHIHETDPTKKAVLAADIARLDHAIDGAMAAIRASDAHGNQIPLLHQFERAWDSYLALPASHSNDGVADQRFSAVTAAVQALIQSKAAAARATNADNAASYATARWLIIGVTLLSVLIGLGLAFLLARRIGHAVTQVARASQGLAQGDLDQQIAVRSRDELGQMADAFRAMVMHQRSMAAAADTIAQGDLSADIRPQSERDVLGSAFQRMVATLRRMAATADDIARGELAEDIQPQSERDVLGVAFQRMVGNLRQLVGEFQQAAGASDEILSMASQQAAGANEQSAAIAETTATVDQVKTSAGHAVQLAEVVTESAKQANRIATDGVAAVRQATAGMEDIRHKVQQIAAAMGNINQATTQGLAATKSTQQAAQHLTELAGRLNGLAVQYQV